MAKKKTRPNAIIEVASQGDVAVETAQQHSNRAERVEIVKNCFDRTGKLFKGATVETPDAALLIERGFARPAA